MKEITCSGSVCVECGFCNTCQRYMTGPRHIDVCACPDPSGHYVCEECQAITDMGETIKATTTWQAAA